MAEQTDQRQDTFTFFDALYGYVPDNKHGLLWTLQNKRSTWHDIGDGTDKAAESALRLADDGMDVYVAVSVANDAGTGDTRIKSDNSGGLMGLWADIDIAQPDVHKKYNLPPSEDAAMELLDACGMPPTLVVHSGHGLQAWWLFNEFWDFDDGAGERAAAAGLAQRWNATLRVRAAERHWTIDSTFDLARVMRVPGTMNRKGTPIMPVRLLIADGPRWNPDDFDEYTVDDSLLTERGIVPTQTYIPDKVELTEAAEPPFEKFQYAIANDETFERTWKRQRKDLADQSASSYDLSVATQLALGGFTDQEIANAIIAWRRQHKEDVQKALRQDYIRRTLARARTAAGRVQALEEIDEHAEAHAAAKESGDPEAERETGRVLLDDVSKILAHPGAEGGPKMDQVVRYTSEPPTFAICFGGIWVDFGGIEGITNSYRFYNTVLAAIGYSIPQFKSAQWHAFCAWLPRVWDDVDVGLESTNTGQTYSWLVQYLDQRPPMPSLEEADATKYPFMHDGEVHIFADNFKRWIYLQHQEAVKKGELGKRLTVYGAVQHPVNCTINGRRTSRLAWRLPELVAPVRKSSGKAVVVE